MTVTTRQDKVLATIERVKARIEKLQSMTKDQIEKKYSDAFWHELDIEHAKEQLANNIKKLEEAKRLDAKEEALNCKKNLRNEKLSLIPESLKSFQKWLENSWIEQSLKIHEILKNKPYPEFNDRSAEANAIRADRFFDEEKVRKDAKRDSEDLVIDLMNRVEKKCGNIIDVSHLCLENANEGMVINGFIEGDKGSAIVQSILAGGYNIQRLHVRVLVK